jgi:hypothetical protein
MMSKREMFEAIRTAIQNGKQVTVQIKTLPAFITDPLQVVSCFTNERGVDYVTVKHDNPWGGTVSHHAYANIHSFAVEMTAEEVMDAIKDYDYTLMDNFNGTLDVYVNVDTKGFKVGTVKNEDYNALYELVISAYCH